MSKNLIAGVSLGLGGIEAVLIDGRFNILESKSFPFPGKLGKETIASKIEKALTSLSNFHNVYAVGVALPAQFDEENKKVVKSSIEELVGANFYQLLSKRISAAIFIYRRNNCGMLAEQAFGEAKEAKNAVWVEIGRDISSSLLLAGKIYRGSNNAAGEISEIIVDITREKRSAAGEFGALVSGEGISALTGKSVYDILKESTASTIITKQILRDLRESLLTGLYNVKVLLDPDLFIISGDIVENFNLFRSSFIDLGVKVVKSDLGRRGPALGAALAAFNQIRKRP